jgi:thymidylate synthase (FAD)
MRLSWDSEEAEAEMDASVTTVDTITEACRMSFETYKQLLRRGVPREIARTILPVSTYSKMFATVNLHNLFHFLKLRLHQHAQYEIRQYAEAMLTLIKSVAPVSVAAFIETQLVPQGYNDEQQAANKA